MIGLLHAARLSLTKPRRMHSCFTRWRAVEASAKLRVNREHLLALGVGQRPLRRALKVGAPANVGLMPGSDQNVEIRGGIESRITTGFVMKTCRWGDDLAE